MKKGFWISLFCVVAMASCRLKNQQPQEVVIEVQDPDIRHDTIYIDGADLLVVKVREETITAVYLDDTTNFSSLSEFESYLQQHASEFATVTVQLEAPVGHAPERTGEVLRMMTDNDFKKFRMNPLDE